MAANNVFFTITVLLFAPLEHGGRQGFPQHCSSLFRKQLRLTGLWRRRNFYHTPSSPSNRKAKARSCTVGHTVAAASACARWRGSRPQLAQRKCAGGKSSQKHHRYKNFPDHRSSPAGSNSVCRSGRRRRAVRLAIASGAKGVITKARPCTAKRISARAPAGQRAH